MGGDEIGKLKSDLPNYEFLPSGILKPHEFGINFWTEPSHFLDADKKQSNIEDWSAVFSDGVSLPGQKAHGPFGLSGSPVWRLGASGKRVSEWTPECSQLVGVVTHWDKENKILIATQASKI